MTNQEIADFINQYDHDLVQKLGEEGSLTKEEKSRLIQRLQEHEEAVD